MEMSNSNSNVVSMDKKYKTMDGRSVRIICTDRKGDEYSVVALVNDGNFEHAKSYTAEGFFWSSDEESRHDLVEVTPYEDWKVDDLIMVRDSDVEKWIPRYFAGVRDGVLYAWNNGYTSYTANGGHTNWCQARKPTAEELESMCSKV